MIRFLHAADLHLGLRLTRFDENACNRIGEARYFALQQLRQAAADRHVDFVVIAGDVFDDHSVTRQQATRAFEMLESSQHACPVYVISGNHDPLVAGGVWDRDPWLRDQPHRRVKVLREAQPIDLANVPVTIFPCPLQSRRSMEDPTAWIERYARNRNARIRIGVAHGSLNIMPLPQDDHLINADAAAQLDLDYLALGHWHKPYLHRSSDGVVRTAYSGVHEPMRFPGMTPDEASGWSSYSSDGDAERFQDDGHGHAILVTIEAAQAPPQIEPIEIGRLRWLSEQRDLTALSLGSVVSEYSRRENPERSLLRLMLSGVLEPREYARLIELEEIILNRYHAGSNVDIDAVLIQPSAEQLRETVGPGVLSRVLARLQEDSHSHEPGAQRIAAHALKMLYQMAWEEQPL